MAVSLYAPQISVQAFRMSNRNHAGLSQRVSSAPQAIELTPYLGDQGGVRTIKSVLEPAGAFTISFADQSDPDIGDSIYGLVEPMDLIEIRASRLPHLYAGSKLPLIMRGFVSEIRRREGITGDGKPARTVTIIGQDAGKLLQIYQVFWEVAPLTDGQYLTEFKFQAATGMQVGYAPVSDFFSQLFLNYINGKIAALQPFAGGQLKPFQVAASVTEGVVSQTLVGGYLGPLWGLVEQFCDRPWNEAFITDTEAGPVFVFRPTPFFDIDGNPIGGAKDPGTAYVTDADIVSLDVSRGDSRVANFFWCPPDASSFDTSAYLTASRLQNGGIIETGYANDDPAIYGLKKMTAATHLVPSPDFGPAQPPAQRGQTYAGQTTWFDQRTSLLRQMNRDNSVLEEGRAVLKGAEWLKVGTYLQIKRGALSAKYYMPEVAHSFTPFGNWTTTVALHRGTGFLARLAAEGAPMWAEGRAGPYDPGATLSLAEQNANLALAGG